MRRPLYTITTFLILACISCLDPFSFDQEDLDDSIVVDGQFTSTDGPHTLRTSSVLAFGSKFFDPVVGIQARLHYKGMTLPFTEVEPGVHVIEKGVITGIPGEEYSVSMTLPNGDEVSSSPEVLPKAYDLDEVNARFKYERIVSKSGVERRERVLEVTINSEYPEIDNGEEFYLRFGIDEDYSYPEPNCGGLHMPKTCYVNKPAFTRDFSLFNSLQSSKSRIDSLMVLRRQDLSGIEFRGVHYFSVLQYSITPGAYEYWQRVKEVTTQEGTVFDKPPAAVPGNMKNTTNPNAQVLGYFEMASISIERRKILPSEYFDGAIDQDECSIFNRFRWPNRCCNCLNLKDATVNRPPWF